MDISLLAIGVPLVAAPQGASQTMTTQQQYIDWLANLHALQAVGLAAFGGMCLFMGWKIFKYVVVINAAAIGAYGGYQLGHMLEGANSMMPTFGAIAGALLLGAAAWPLMKTGVALMGAAAGFVLGYGGWHFLARAMARPGLAEFPWIGAVIGAVALGLLSFPAFRFVVMTFTSFQGAMFAVAGAVSLLLKHEDFREPVIRHLEGSNYMLPLLILLPTVLGFTFQYTSSGKKKKPAG